MLEVKRIDAMDHIDVVAGISQRMSQAMDINAIAAKAVGRIESREMQEIERASHRRALFVVRFKAEPRALPFMRFRTCCIILRVSLILSCLEISTLGAPAVPVMRLFRIEGFIQGFTRVAMGLVSLILVYLAGIAIVFFLFPKALPQLAILAILGLAAAYWFSRPAYGAARGLPPGSLSLVASFEAIFDHRFYLKQAQRHGPVFKMMQFHKPLVCVVGLEKGHEYIHMPDDILGPAPQPFSADIPGGFLRYMNPPTHAVYALKFRTAFSRSVTVAAEPVIRVALQSELDKMTEDCSSGRGVLPAPYMHRAVFVSFAYLIFGFAPGSQELNRFRSNCRLFEAQDLARPLRPETLKVLSELRNQVL